MLYIFCPYCLDHRSEEEFTYAGEARILRPANPRAVTDSEWGDYLFFRENPKGDHYELWCHTSACRRYFEVSRNTVDYRILDSFEL